MVGWGAPRLNLSGTRNYIIPASQHLRAIGMGNSHHFRSSVASLGFGTRAVLMRTDPKASGVSARHESLVS